MSLEKKYKLVRKEEGTLDEAKAVFFDAFHAQYKKYDPITELGLKPLEYPSGDVESANYTILDAFLQMAFEEETARFDNILQNGQQADGETIEFFYQVETASTVVGYASIQFEPSKCHCYVHQLGVSSNHWGRGIGKKLVFALRESGICPGLQRVSVLTRRINQEGINFYKHMGFEEVHLDATDDDFLDFTKYIQLEWKKK